MTFLQGVLAYSGTVMVNLLFFVIFTFQTKWIFKRMVVSTYLGFLNAIVLCITHILSYVYFFEATDLYIGWFVGAILIELYIFQTLRVINGKAFNDEEWILPKEYIYVACTTYLVLFFKTDYMFYYSANYFITHCFLIFPQRKLEIDNLIPVKENR